MHDIYRIFESVNQKLQAATKMKKGFGLGLKESLGFQGGPITEHGIDNFVPGSVLTTMHRNVSQKLPLKRPCSVSQWSTENDSIIPIEEDCSACRKTFRGNIAFDNQTLMGIQTRFGP